MIVAHGSRPTRRLLPLKHRWKHKRAVCPVIECVAIPLEPRFDFFALVDEKTISYHPAIGGWGCVATLSIFEMETETSDLHFLQRKKKIKWSKCVEQRFTSNDIIKNLRRVENTFFPSFCSLKDSMIIRSSRIFSAKVKYKNQWKKIHVLTNYNGN